MSEEPAGWANESLDLIIGKWFEDEGAGAFRYCPSCARPLIAPFGMTEAPQCSGCEREFMYCGCLSAHES